MDSNETELHSIFEYLNLESMSFNTIEYLSLFNLLDANQEVDYEELMFEHRLKKRSKKNNFK